MTTAVDETLSVSEAARLVGVPASTLRRMFDDQPAEAGRWIDAGKTGERERRVDPAWAERMRAVVEARRANGLTARPRDTSRMRRGAGGQFARHLDGG